MTTRIRGPEHKEEMKFRSQILRAKMLGFRELLLTMISGGIVPDILKTRFRELDAMTPETVRVEESKTKLLHEANGEKSLTGQARHDKEAVKEVKQ